MAITLPDSRGLPDDVMQALRLRALHGIESGFSQADVARLLGVAGETVSRWWTAYTASGLGARPQDRTGRPVGTGRTLSDEQCARLQQSSWTRRARRIWGSPRPCGTVVPFAT